MTESKHGTKMCQAPKQNKPLLRQLTLAKVLAGWQLHREAGQDVTNKPVGGTL